MQEEMLQSSDVTFRTELPDVANSLPQNAREHILNAVREAECAPEIGRILNTWAECCAKILDLVVAAVQKYMEALPKGTVFSASEYSGYSAPLCTLMRELENADLALRRAMLSFFTAQSCFSDRQTRAFLAEQLCREAVGRCPELRETAEQALADLAQEQSDARRTLTRGEQCQEELELYIRTQLPAFCLQLGKGKAENDIGMFAVCGAFCDRTQNLVSMCRTLHAETQAAI